MPILRHLELSLDDSALPPLLLGDAPLLRSVALAYVIETVILPWAQLTSLTLKSVIPRLCTPILQQTVGLVYFKLDLFVRGDIQEPDIELPRLQTLILRPADSDVMLGYLETFIVPALLTLQVPEAFLGEDPIRTLTSFISKSGCKLQRLYMSGEGSTTMNLYRAAFPSIPTLKFDSEPVGDYASYTESRSLPEQ
ncbi:hypothetical protein C8R43DRAFT_1051374 [Mycena crocata]|nr:hypothetical protein C8R43DRAFT_1051374 [Mycena crocata]